MADVEILAQQVEAAPLIYDIPGGQEILIKCLSASFDGTSAGGAWVPAIQIIGPSGQTLRTFPLSTSVAAGGSADVSWFRAVGGGKGGSTVSTGFASYSGSTTLANDDTEDFDLTWDAVAGQEDMFDLTNPALPKARQAGIYTIDYSVTARHTGALTGTLTIAMDLNNSAGGSGFANGSGPLAPNDGAVLSPSAFCSLTWPLQAGDTFDNAVSQNSGGTLHVLATFDATRISVS